MRKGFALSDVIRYLFCSRFLVSYISCGLLAFLGPVVRGLVCANRWLRGVKTYMFPWYLTLFSANHASSNPGQVAAI